MLNKLPAVKQGELIRTGQASVSEVLEAHIESIDQSEQLINAFVTLDVEGSRKKAIELDNQKTKHHPEQPLYGLPVGIKDHNQVAGLPCTFGSLAFQDYIPDFDAAHVSNIRQAGAIILGKTNMPEFGHGRYGGQTDNLLCGLTRNPWNTEKTASSSSGGAAAALAANFVSLADGSDIAGSIRGPAGWCGLYGLRPTSGVVPAWPKVDPLDGTSVIGPMARTIDDLALLFAAMRGPHHAPLYETPEHFNSESFDPSNLRIAWCMNPGGSNTCDAVMDTLSPLKTMLIESGAKVTETEPDLAGLHQAQAILRRFGLLVNHEKMILEHEDLISPEIRKALERAQALSKVEIVDAIRVRDQAVHTITSFFTDYDLMIWPTSTQLPFDAEAKEIHEDWTPIELTPVLQLPALSVPVAMTPDSMPCGVQFIGPKRSDLKLIELAKILEPEIGFVGRYSAMEMD